MIAALPVNFTASAGCSGCDLRLCPPGVPSDLAQLLRRERARPKRPLQPTWSTAHAVLVVGPESSGTKLVARITAALLGFSRSGRSGAESARAWPGHGARGSAAAGFLIVHRSLPHAGCFPRLKELLRVLDAGLGVRSFSLVLVTRDPGAALRAKVESHQPDPAAAQLEQA